MTMIFNSPWQFGQCSSFESTIHCVFAGDAANGARVLANDGSAAR